MDCLVSPPQPGDESYDTFIKVSFKLQLEEYFFQYTSFNRNLMYLRIELTKLKVFGVDQHLIEHLT